MADYYSSLNRVLWIGYEYLRMLYDRHQQHCYQRMIEAFQNSLLRLGFVAKLPSPHLKYLSKGVRSWRKFGLVSTVFCLHHYMHDSAGLFSVRVCSELQCSLESSHDTAVGPDGIHDQFLKHFPKSALRLLLHLFNWHLRVRGYHCLLAGGDRFPNLVKPTVKPTTIIR